MPQLPCFQAPSRCWILWLVPATNTDYLTTFSADSFVPTLYINILSNVQKVWFPWYLRTLYIDWNTSMYEILDSNWLKKWMQIAQGYFSQGLSAIGWSSNCKMHWLPLAPSFQRALHFPSLWPPINGQHHIIWKMGWIWLESGDNIVFQRVILKNCDLSG